MAVDDRLLRTADEFVAIAKRNGFDRLQDFGDLFEAFEIAVSRTFGMSVPYLVRQDEVRMIREIWRVIVTDPASKEHRELQQRAMAVCFARGALNLNQTIDRLGELVLADAIPAPAEETAT